VKRGEIWTASGGPDYAGKPRPVLIVQDDRLGITASITICPFTSTSREAPLFRAAIKPTVTNGLGKASYVMIDKVTTVARQRLGRPIGHLSADDMIRIDRLLLVFLGLAK
jgi:mRNA interferase MazF